MCVLGWLLLIANGRPIGVADPRGPAGWLWRGALAASGSVIDLDATGQAIVGKLLAALFAALAGAALFAAITLRHGTGEAVWGALALVGGTTLAAAAQAWSGEAPAAFAVAAGLWLLAGAEAGGDAARAARAGLPLALAVAFQPSTLALALVLALVFLLRWRRAILPFLGWGAPGIALAVFGALMADASGTDARSPSPSPLALLVSPAKGALVFVPVALVGAAGLLRAARKRRSRFWDQPEPSRLLPIACGLAVLAHFAWLAVSGGWDAGVFWGPRLVAPAWPPLLLFLPEGLALLRLLGSALVVLSIGIQALGLVSYDGRWDRLQRGRGGELGAATWNPSRSPIAFQWRERVVRPALLGLEGRRLVVRERALVGDTASGSYVSFREGRLHPTGVDATMEALRLEKGAHVVGDRLELPAPGDGMAFRVRDGARPRRLELRISCSGRGAIGMGESSFWRNPRWQERAVSGPFRLRFPYHFAESGGPDLVVALRTGGPVAIESISLVPPSEPENVIRLP